jgi:hypothetical protein
MGEFVHQRAGLTPTAMAGIDDDRRYALLFEGHPGPAIRVGTEQLFTAACRHLQLFEIENYHADVSGV